MKNLKVLLIEDEEKLAKLLKDAIKDHFKSFIVAYDGEDGFNKFLQYSPDIIISDIMLPKINGLELVKKIKSINQNIPIIMISAYSDKEKLLDAIEIGVKKYFIKPFDPEELIDFIKKLDIKTINKINLIDNFYYDVSNNSLYNKDKYIKLTTRERNFLNLLISQPNYLISLDKLNILWNDEQITNETVRTFIKRFRQKTSKNLIENIKGQGYRLVTL